MWCTVSHQDWEDLEKLANFLVFFEDTTLANESRFATVELILPAMDILLEKLEEAKIKYQDDLFMGPCCNAAWDKLNKYYSMTDRSPVYIAAMVLSPQWKWTYFEANWPLDWVVTARNTVETFWESEYKPVSLLNQPKSQPMEVQNHYLEWRFKKRGASTVVLDEYQQYIRAATIDVPDIDPRSWWLEPTQQKTFPHLSQMALDLLSIPAMAAEPERLFQVLKSQLLTAVIGLE